MDLTLYVPVCFTHGPLPKYADSTKEGASAKLRNRPRDNYPGCDCDLARIPILRYGPDESP